jgi:fructokinase
MNEARYRIGIDLGGTKIEAVALDLEGREIARRRITTEAQGGAEHIINRIAGLYAGMVYTIDDAPHSIGVGTPGAISPLTGLLKNSNTVCLNGQPLKEMLEAALHHPVTIENDANCFALAEARAGAGQGHACVFGVILGTGCGGGIVINGQVRRGPQAIAGEWGHMVIDPQGPPCYCGARGCVETFISGGGLEARYRDAIARRSPAINDLQGIASTEQIHQGMLAGDALCVEVMDEYFSRFGQALANLIAVLDPDIIVLGGGLSKLPEIYTRGVAEVAKRAFTDELTTPIVQNSLGDSAGVIGAAWL